MSGAVGTIVLLFYTVMTGASISALRALIMFSVRMGAEVTGSQIMTFPQVLLWQRRCLVQKILSVCQMQDFCFLLDHFAEFVC